MQINHQKNDVKRNKSMLYNDHAKVQTTAYFRWMQDVQAGEFTDNRTNRSQT